jgi:hypothetical protein
MHRLNVARLPWRVGRRPSGLRKILNVQGPCGAALAPSVEALATWLVVIVVGGGGQSQETTMLRRNRMAYMTPYSRMRFVRPVSRTTLRDLVVQLHAVHQRCVALRFGQARDAGARAVPRPPGRRPRPGYSAAHHPYRARPCTASQDSYRGICRSASPPLPPSC